MWQQPETKKFLGVEIAAELHDLLVDKAIQLSITEAELVEQGLQLLFGAVSLLQPSLKTQLKAELIADLKLELNTQIEQQLAHALRLGSPALDAELQIKSSTATDTSENINEISPSVRQLCVGDRVQIRDPDSPYYMEKLQIVKVGMIRADVATDHGEQSFLKRYLRFVPSEESVSGSP